MRLLFATLVFLALLCGSPSFAQGNPQRKQFAPGALRRAQDLPPGRLRDRIERLPAQARDRAVAWLANIHFTEEDTRSMQVDASGGVYYVDDFRPGPAPVENSTESFSTSSATVPISPFPSGLIFHSKPGAPNVIYLNFSGETVVNTEWNTSIDRTSIPAVPFSKDTDYTTFSDSEQLAIRRIWQRVAEDYASFDVDVTTERPATFTARTAHALVTRHTDDDGQDNPAPGSGGVAYVNAFGTSSFARYRPAWIYSDNLSGEESYIAEAVSHEIGHNLGLTHDGKTDGADYYGGHGSGETSWGPIMGTGYNRNVSQWSEGDYYLANNTQDDLATIAGKLSYRSDDHGGTIGSATALNISGSGTIVSTTPETDPSNNSPVNKGRLERNNDVDMFSFTAGSGPISLTIAPWIVSSATTRGGNLDLLVELYNSSGQLLLTNNVSSRTGASIQTNVIDGVYYLAVKNTSTGNPFISTPTGYSSYGSIGQYFISGTVLPSGVVIPPGAELAADDITDPVATQATFTVTYTDDVGINSSTIDNNDIQVTGPNGYTQIASLVSVDSASNGTPRVATYSIQPPSIFWSDSNNGLYSVSILAGAVSDIQGEKVPAALLGTFTINLPRTLYVADLSANPGWDLPGLWNYGQPLYLLGTGPTSGYSGTSIVGYNLSGNYENRLSPIYATTDPINCVGSSSVTLQFRRWLRVRSGDIANIQISLDGTSWSDLWVNSGAVQDSAWQLVQYSLPSNFAGNSTLQIRWGLASGQSGTDIGWNIDDVVLLGSSTLDTTLPTATLAVQNITQAGQASHPILVTYSDDTAVRISSLDNSDLIIVGPGGTNTVTFSGVDNTSDGTPRTATYSLSAPSASWNSNDNGQYNVYLKSAEVTDTSGNSSGTILLGSFTVAIAGIPQAIVVNSQSITVTEGSQSSFTVRLAAQPSANVTVVSAVNGDDDLEIISGATNIFTPQTWDIPAIVTVRARQDADQQNGTATIVCQSDSLAPVNVAATELDNTPTPPTVSLTSPANNSQFVSTDSIVLSANASDDGTVAKVEFFANGALVGTDTTASYSTTSSLAPGSYSITAKATDNVGASATSSPISITVIPPNQPPTIVISSPSSGANFLTTDAITISANASDDEAIFLVEFFINGLRINTDSSAPFTFATNLPAGSYTLTAKAIDSGSLATTSAPVTIYVSLPNQPPTIAISSPTNNATFLTTDTITIVGAAADDNFVSSVRFFRNNTLLSTDTTAPYSISTTFTAGTHTVLAVATDNAGLSTTSAPVTVHVSLPDQPPTVAISSPTNNATFLTTDTITIVGAAADDNSVSSVRFFRNNTLLSTDTTSPFSIFTTFTAGTHTVLAVATDNAGLSTTSAPVTVQVSLPNQPPTVALTSPTNGATFLTTNTVTITAAANDDSAIASVDFLVGNTIISTDSNAPFTVTTTFSAGSHTLVAIARDDRGLSTASAPVAINVTVPNQAPIVTLTSPTNGSSHLTTNSVAITASASDDETVSMVEFFIDDNLVAIDSTAPFAFTTNFTPGTHSISAKATDNKGVSTTAASISINVTPPNQAPAVAITSPVNGSSHLTTNTITIAASATDDETVSTVEFFIDDNLVATDSTAPFAFTTNFAVGTHAISAKAIDNEGAASVSSLVTINVSLPNQAPFVMIVSPTNSATVLTTDIISIAVDASDDHAVARVEFFADNQILGFDDSAPFSYAATLPAGSRILTARAIDESGASALSSEVTITVERPNAPPSIVLLSPSHGATFQSAESVTFTLDAADDGQITKVDLFANTNLLSTLTEAPYTLSTAFTPGSYVITACATDDRGLISTSAPIVIEIIEPIQPPELLNVTYDRNLFQITGTPGGDAIHVLEMTSDFLSWIPVTTNTPGSANFAFSIPAAVTNAFFRVTVRLPASP